LSEWPGQAHATEAKIPAFIGCLCCITDYVRLLFNSRPSGPPIQVKTSRAVGAAAYKIDGDEGKGKRWQLARHFKLQLHLAPMRSSDWKLDDPLPFDMMKEKIYADFFKYL
jgi:hypothetical protein